QRPASHEVAEPAADDLSTEAASSAGAQIAVLPNRPAQIAEKLELLAKDGQNSADFEQIIADALSFLGFETKAIGGPGKTDVVAIAPLGPLRFKVVIDAKTTSNNTVGNHLIDWLAIKKHKDDEWADHACVVGRAFSGGALRTQAEEFEVALLKAEDLAEIVLVHSLTPVSLAELRTVFATIPDTSPAIAGIRLSANHRERRLRLIKYLLKQIDQFNREQEDIVMAKPDMMWAAVAASSDQSIKGTSRDDVVDALHLLETIGVLAKSNGDGYVSQTSLDGAMQMLAAVSALAQETDVSQQSAQSKSETVS
ncbi:MAG: restriction endonuclease, partial [Chloroflexi bacterium]|nr:restriction endonuclease [Chloroflexota bacterium]